MAKTKAPNKIVTGLVIVLLTAGAIFTAVTFIPGVTDWINSLRPGTSVSESVSDSGTTISLETHNIDF